MSDAIEFLVPLPPVALRRNSETRSDGYKRKLRREYSREVYAAWLDDIMPEPVDTPWERAHLTLTWRSIRQPPDADNVVGNCKVLVDAIRCQQPQDSKDTGRYWLGLIANDDPGCVLSVTPKVEKLPPSRRADEGVLVTIRRDDGA